MQISAPTVEIFWPIGVMVGGWIANWATLKTKQDGLDKRVAHIEKNYISREILEEKDKTRAERDRAINHRLANIEQSQTEILTILLGSNNTNERKHLQINS